MPLSLWSSTSAPFPWSYVFYIVKLFIFYNVGEGRLYLRGGCPPLLWNPAGIPAHIMPPWNQRKQYLVCFSYSDDTIFTKVWCIVKLIRCSTWTFNEISYTAHVYFLQLRLYLFFQHTNKRYATHFWRWSKKCVRSHLFLLRKSPGQIALIFFFIFYFLCNVSNLCPLWHLCALGPWD